MAAEFKSHVLRRDEKGLFGIPFKRLLLGGVGGGLTYTLTNLALPGWSIPLAIITALLIVRPPDAPSALDLARDIALSRVVELVILDRGWHRSALALRQLHPALRDGSTALLLLTATPIEGTPVCLHIACRAWLRDEQDVTGCLGTLAFNRARHCR